MIFLSSFLSHQALIKKCPLPLLNPALNISKVPNSYLLVAIIDTVIVLPNFDLEGARGATRPNHAVSCRQNPIGADQRPPTDMSSFVHPKRGHPGPCTWLCVYPSDDS